MTQTKLKKTNNRWYLYKEHGCFYKLEDGVLMQCAMNADGTRDINPGEVDWDRGIDAEDMPRMKEIVKELEGKE